MNRFEQKLQDSAQRIRESETRNLRVPENPRGSRHFQWGWVAAPVAAVLGILLGYSLKMNGGNENENYIARADTVYVPHIEHDTIINTFESRDTVYLVKYRSTVNSQRSTETSQQKENIAQNDTKTDSQSSNPQIEPEECTSVACDGINYAMLVMN